MTKRYSVILGNLGNTRDRFMGGGYKTARATRDMIAEAASIKGLSGLELVGTWDVTRENYREVGQVLRDHGLACVSIIPDIFARPAWGKGALVSRDPAIRKACVDEIRMNAEIAQALGCPLLNIWPGQDGYDYPLQDDYLAARGWLQESLAKAASEFPALKFALEYKLKEPRTHSYLARVSDTMLVIHDLGLDNVGVCIDTGHALMAYENLGEAAVLAGKRLFHMHFNDNFRYWDDDMIVGSVHAVEHIELLYWLDRVQYAGWYSMDQYPYREDGRGAIEESLRWLQGFQALVTQHRAAMDALLREGNAVKTSAFLRSILLPS
ncbi:MAG: TIM barrel protein [Verrucomicrobia bacterium]|nr:TIM barrel protein [Verrucomicrobiota bacterium]